MATAPVEQLRTWQRSCVLRVPTSTGNLIFKASPAMFGEEPRITKFLAQEYPTNFPEVLAIDARKGWTLMRELVGSPLSDVRDLALWADALRAFARIQVAIAARTGDLIRCGCHAWPLQRLTDRTTALLGDTKSMLIGTACGLTEGEARELQLLGPALGAIIRQLFLHGLPLTLEHGDFRPAQIFVVDGGIAFFDVSDSAITHPFISAVTLLDFEEIPADGTTPEAARTYLRNAYLEEWMRYEPMDRLVEAFELARVVAILYAALYRHDIVLPHIQPKERWEFMIPLWQKKLLLALRKRASAP
jgi:hypothetical protein